MKIDDSPTGKVCKEQDAAKYVSIASEPSGYAKLCCYAVKFLKDHDIFASYENICVALWKMFPKCENFHLAGYDDMPDTDYMEKLIKLRSTPKNQNYLTGGNFQGKRSEFGYAWQLTGKGELFAQEVEEILAGSNTGSTRAQEQRKSTFNYESSFRKIWQSKLWQKYEAGEEVEKAAGVEIASALDFLYSSSSFAEDLKEIKHYYEKELKKAENEGISDPRIAMTADFLKRIGGRGKAVAKHV